MDRSAVGSIMCAIIYTRPELALVTSILSQLLSNPSQRMRKHCYTSSDICKKQLKMESPIRGQTLRGRDCMGILIRTTRVLWLKMEDVQRQATYSCLEEGLSHGQPSDNL
jgi:hypothetical protein